MIYMAKNKINNKIYIGKTTKLLEKRIYLHFHTNDGTYFHNALKKYGSENFEWSILDESNDDNYNKEIYYINLYKSNIKEIGYNCTTGGDGGDTITNNKNKKSILKKRSNTFKKLWKTNEYRTKMIAKRQELKNNKEFINKVSKNSSKMWSDKNKRKQHSKKIKNIWKNNKEKFMKNRPSRIGENNPMAKQYNIIDNLGNIYTTKNLKSFCNEKNINYSTILKYLNKGLIPPPIKNKGKNIMKIVNWQITDIIV